MLNETLLLQFLLIIILPFFLLNINILIAWYAAGIYLLTLGLYLLVNQGDIFIGFLWVIDFGVGLIFFIFILHFSNFLYQHSRLDISNRILLYSFFFIFFTISFLMIYSFPIDSSHNLFTTTSWFWMLSWYDYFEIQSSTTLNNLQLLREMYFFNNSLGFVIINYMLLYAIFTSINLIFFGKKIFNIFYLKQLKYFRFIEETNSNFFIRNQNFLRQQNTSSGAKVWIKNKFFSNNDPKTKLSERYW